MDFFKLNHIERRKKVCSDEYISWLEDITAKKDSFNSDMDELEKANYTEQDLNNIERLSTLFLLLTQYAILKDIPIDIKQEDIEIVKLNVVLPNNSIIQITTEISDSEKIIVERYGTHETKTTLQVIFIPAMINFLKETGKL